MKNKYILTQMGGGKYINILLQIDRRFKMLK